MRSGLEVGFSLCFDWGCQIREGSGRASVAVSGRGAGSRGTVPQAENGKPSGEEINLLTID